MTGKVLNEKQETFNLEECILSKQILDESGIPLYGVQNHYSLLDRTWEKEGLAEWCRKNDVSLWAWAVLEEGMLVPPKKGEKKSVMKLIFARKRKRMFPLYRKMQEIGKAHKLTAAQVAMCYVSSKGLVPICGCRRPEQVSDLAEAVKVQLSQEEILQLEKDADQVRVKILGADMFRFAVKK